MQSTINATALERIRADIKRAAEAAERYRLRGKMAEAYRALGIAEGLTVAAGYIEADQ